MVFTNVIEPRKRDEFMRIRLNDVLVKYWEPKFKDFYFHRRRNKYIQHVDGILKDLREIDDVLELVQNYSLTDFLTHFDLSEKFTKNEIGLIEDSAYYLRYLEITDKNNFNILDKDVWVGMNPLRK